MMKVVALGLVPGSQSRVLAVPLPRVVSAVALALVWLQVCACNQPVQHWGLEALGGFATCSLLLIGALFALPRAGEHCQPVPRDGLDVGERGGEMGSGHPFPSTRPRELLMNTLVLRKKNAAACLKLPP